jgi:carboxypeptidase Q
MDEEIAQRGGKKFAEEAELKKEKIIAAIESDEGVFTPNGFAVDASEAVKKKMESWRPIFLQYGLYNLAYGYSGVDIHPLKNLDIPLFALMTDSQRYFDSHHGPDRFEAVNKREMQLGSASIAMLIYLIDKYGLE